MSKPPAAQQFCSQKNLVPYILFSLVVFSIILTSAPAGRGFNLATLPPLLFGAFLTPFLSLYLLRRPNAFRAAFHLTVVFFVTILTCCMPTAMPPIFWGSCDRWIVEAVVVIYPVVALTVGTGLALLVGMFAVYDCGGGIKTVYYVATALWALAVFTFAVAASLELGSVIRSSADCRCLPAR